MQVDRGIRISEIATPKRSRSVSAPPAGVALRSSLVGAIRLMGAVISYDRNEEIHGEDEPAEFVYMVVRGAVRAYKLLSDGRRQIARAQELLLLLGRKSARERVATFLLDMASRVADGSAIELPMSRQDIADYLGLTIETVSRTLSQMEHSATIALPTCRRIELRNRNVLSRLDS
jgi:CRP-like cAMP-binding protein